MSYWGKYVPVEERRQKALKAVNKLRKKGKNIVPIKIVGKTIARSFWGKQWCDYIESFSDFENRLPRGRTYVRNGSICHLEVQPGYIKGMIYGSSMYHITIRIKELKKSTWESIKKTCSGQIASLLELLQGKISDQVMGVVTDEENGLFPQKNEIEFDCSCPDWADMCKHVAAVLYGVGSRLDDSPESLFLLRGVDAEELVPAEINLTTSSGEAEALDEDKLGDVFGIEFDDIKEITTEFPKNKKKEPLPIQQIFTGKSIVKIRKKLELTILQFATKLGVTAPTVYRWESSKKEIRMNKRSYNAIRAIGTKEG